MYLQARIEYNIHRINHKSGRMIDKKFKRIFYQFKCDQCNSDFEKDASHIASKRRLNNGCKHFCTNCFTPALGASLGKASYRKMLDQRSGEKQIDSCGYMTVYMANTHPYYNGYCGRLREHILVMENHLGRAMEKGEVVHHIDGNKTNNDIDNLDLCTVQEHNACHGTSETIVFELYKRGIVGYDRITKRYFLKE